MAVQDHCGGNQSGTCGNNYSPKIRKPYTITKQRERWTEEEHNKFLEALKLHGRAWRRIEEHVGTKTAVQIRSHAQKFFSKIVREGSGTNASAVEPVEIPPPRPKRKPMHPYPRKTVHPLGKELLVLEDPVTSSSANLSISERENQSPTSVLSTVGSDVLGSTDSNAPNLSLSPVSCASGSRPADFTVCNSNLTSEDHGSASPATAIAEARDEQSVKVQNFELFPKENTFSEDCLVEETSTRSLKLFGRTILVPECQSCSNLDTNDIKPVQPQPWHFTIAEPEPGNGGCSRNSLPQVPSRAFYFVQNCDSMEAVPSTPLQCWAFCGGIPFPFIPFSMQELTRERLDSNEEEIQDKEIEKEGSWIGPNSGSAIEGENVDKSTNGETESQQVSYEAKELHPNLELKPSQITATSNNCTKGFVLYKKRRAERHCEASAITGIEREEERRIRLCL